MNLQLDSFRKGDVIGKIKIALYATITMILTTSYSGHPLQYQEVIMKNNEKIVEVEMDSHDRRDHKNI